MKTVLLILLGLVLASPSFAQTRTESGVVVCYTGGDFPLAYNERGAEYEHGGRLMNAAAVRCETLRLINHGLQLSVTGLSIGAAVSTGTVAGIPVSVTLGVGAAGVSYLSFVVSEIDCDKDTEVFKQQIKEAVCEVMYDQNIDCYRDFPINVPKFNAPMCIPGGVYI